MYVMHSKNVNVDEVDDRAYYLEMMSIVDRVIENKFTGYFTVLMNKERWTALRNSGLSADKLRT